MDDAAAALEELKGQVSRGEVGRENWSEIGLSIPEEPEQRVSPEVRRSYREGLDYLSPVSRIMALDYQMRRLNERHEYLSSIGMSSANSRINRTVGLVGSGFTAVSAGIAVLLSMPGLYVSTVLFGAMGVNGLWKSTGDRKIGVIEEARNSLDARCLAPFRDAVPEEGDYVLRCVPDDMYFIGRVLGTKDGGETTVDISKDFEQSSRLVAILTPGNELDVEGLVSKDSVTRGDNLAVEIRRGDVVRYGFHKHPSRVMGESVYHSLSRSVTAREDWPRRTLGKTVEYADSFQGSTIRLLRPKMV